MRHSNVAKRDAPRARMQASGEVIRKSDKDQGSVMSTNSNNKKEQQREEEKLHK